MKQVAQMLMGVVQSVAWTRAPSSVMSARQGDFKRLLHSASQLLPDGDIERPRVVDMRNGKKVKRVFSDDEMSRRLHNLRKYMATHAIGGVLLTSYHNVNYFSGFLYTAFGRPYGLIVTPDKCLTLAAGVDGGQPWRQSYGDCITYTDWQRDNFFTVVREELGDITGYLGIEFDHVNIENYRKLDHVVPHISKVDVGKATMKLRMDKSDEEIALIREGARIANIGGYAAIEVLEEGIPEYEVAMAANRAMVREIAKTFPGSELMDTWTWLQSGINTDGAHNPLTTKRLQSGEILSLNCFPMIAGYYTALERTLFLNTVQSHRHLQLWEINCEVHRRGLSLIKPGVRCSDIANELNEIYQSHDLLEYRSFGYGHSFGTLCHYYGREADLELREDIDTVLKPGNVISMEPMIVIPEGLPGAGGYREHDILIVTENGAENITKFPFGPEHNIVKK